MTKTNQLPPTVGTESAPAAATALPWEGLKPCRLPDRQSIDLVGLPALVRWHMSAKNLHFPQAADAVHQKLMERRDSLTLYVAQSNGEARVVDDADCFGLDRQKVRGVISRGIDGIGGRSGVFSQRVRLPEGVSPGQSAALYVVGAWGNGRYLEAVMDVEGSNARLLAMPCEQAAALFGAGLVVVSDHPFVLSDAFKLLCKKRKESVGGPWNPDQRKTLLNESNCLKSKHGRNDVRSFLAERLGISVQAVNRQIGFAVAAEKEAAEKEAAQNSKTTIHVIK